MYIERVPNRKSPPAVLLRESYREGGKVRKRTLANLSKWPDELVRGLRVLLKGGVALNSMNDASSRCSVIGRAARWPPKSSRATPPIPAPWPPRPRSSPRTSRCPASSWSETGGC